MLLISYIIFSTLVVLSLAQAVYVFLFSRLILNNNSKLVDDNDCPEAAIILCVRGKDPHLKECLNAILGQNYPSFEFHIIVDHVDDPAAPVIHQTIESTSFARLHFLKDPLESCSLKCSSLLQVYSELNDACAFVALLDSDTIPNENWLRSLASGLSDEKVSAVSGIRWYLPPDFQYGSIVRFIWNAAAIVQMVLYRIPWGGTLAIRCDRLNQSNLLERWRSALCEDTMLTSEFGAPNEIVFRPDLFVINQESCSLQNFSSWLTRQLLTVRLYHPTWYLVVVHSMGISLSILTAALILVSSLVSSNYTAGIVVGVGIAIFQVANLGLLFWITKTVHGCIGTPAPNVFNFKYLISTPLTQLFYFVSAIQALATTRIHWRGISYQIRSTKVFRENYSPFASKSSDRQESL